jgi:hypothetical protein
MQVTLAAATFVLGIVALILAHRERLRSMVDRWIVRQLVILFHFYYPYPYPSLPTTESSRYQSIEANSYGIQARRDLRGEVQYSGSATRFKTLD